MARKTVFISDLTGKEISEKDAAKLTITYGDARRGQIVLDVNASEVEDIAVKGVKQARRGRKPKTTA
jgi:sporulation protein YlmC with PRC-barrel domain